jgi:hypothetical protein
MTLNASIMSMANDAPTDIHIGTTRSATMMDATTGRATHKLVMQIASTDPGYHLAGRRIMGMLTLLTGGRNVFGLIHIRIRTSVPSQRPASLERTVKMERTQGQIRPVGSVLLESSRHRLVRPPLFI